MKNIFKHNSLLLALVAMFSVAFTSCDTDLDSNPTLDLSHAADGFRLNVPANSQNNTYDLKSASGVALTAQQPNYGGVPYQTRYYVQVAIDEAFINNAETAHKELATSYTSASLSVDASELNDAVVALFKEANPDSDYPAEPRQVYVRLRAELANMPQYAEASQSFSNVITLNSVLAAYQAPKAELPAELFLVGSPIGTAWTTWQPMAPVYGLAGNFYSVVYVPEGGQLKWGTFQNDWRGYNRFRSVTDKAGADIYEADGDNSNIGFGTAGWYTLQVSAEIVGSSVQYDLTVLPAEVYLVGPVADGEWTGAMAAWALTAPADNTGVWESPAFTGAGELRAHVNVPGFDWWRTEFTLNNGNIYYRNVDIPDNWATNVGDAYSVSCTVGQKLYVDFFNGTGEVK